jgi:hypothetical protein
MKNPIVQEIHRHRAEYARRFDYDVQVIGEDIRRCESESEVKFAAKAPQRNRPLKPARRKMSGSR